jgi:hypothetical protein
MKSKEHFTFFGYIHIEYCGVPNEAVWIKVLTLSGMRSKDDQA